MHPQPGHARFQSCRQSIFLLRSLTTLSLLAATSRYQNRSCHLQSYTTTSGTPTLYYNMFVTLRGLRVSQTYQNGQTFDFRWSFPKTPFPQIEKLLLLPRYWNDSGSISCLIGGPSMAISTLIGSLASGGVGHPFLHPPDVELTPTPRCRLPRRMLGGILGEDEIICRIDMYVYM